MKRLFTTIFLLAFFVFVTLAIIALGRGYRADFGKKTLSSTGLLVATSDPDGAQIFLDGKLKSATNTTLTLPPGWYQVKIDKEGYLPWEKKMQIQGEVVSETRAMLFPSTPSLSPLTKTGVIAPSVSPDGSKIVYAVSSSGLWLLNLTTQPLGFSRDQQLLAKSTSNIDFSAGTFTFSPDSKQILATIGSNYYLLHIDGENQPVFLDWDAWQNLNNQWQGQVEDKDSERLSLLPNELIKIATESGRILSFSFDETKLLYEATASAVIPPNLKPAHVTTNSTPEERHLNPHKIYVYDIKEDKNFLIETPTNNNTSLSWFPSSRHLVMIESNKISILEYDGSNQVTVYSAPFSKFICSSPSANKLLILTSYNQTANLYSLNLR